MTCLKRQDTGLVCDCGSSLDCFLSSCHHPVKFNVSRTESRVFLSDPPLLLLTKEDEHIPRDLSTWGRAHKPGRWEIRDMSLHVDAQWIGMLPANWACNSTGHFSRHFWEQLYFNRARLTFGQGHLFVKKYSFLVITPARSRIQCKCYHCPTMRWILCVKLHSTSEGNAQTQLSPYYSLHFTYRCSALLHEVP